MNRLKSLALPGLLIASWVVLVGGVLAAMQPPAAPLPVFVAPMVTIIVPTTNRA